MTLVGRDLVRRFPGTLAVDRVTIGLRAGHVLGLVGPNGVGKTTLLNLLSGDDRPDCGRVMYGGRDITRLPSHSRARLGIARTIQRPGWFPCLTVLENVWVGLCGTGGISCVQAALAAVGLTGLGQRPAAELSAASRKLLELARLIVMDPAVILLDEPGAGHDARSLGVLVDLIRRWRLNGRSVLVVDHDRALVDAVADDLVMMRDGRLVDCTDGGAGPCSH